MLFDRVRGGIKGNLFLIPCVKTTRLDKGTKEEEKNEVRE